MLNYNIIKCSIFMICAITWIDSRQISTSLRNNNGATARIVGGQNATVNQYTFAAAIQVLTADSTYFCGGTVFTGLWIITAGQCVDGAVLFTTHLGSIYLNEDDPNRQTYAASEYILHPDYNPGTLEYDIGLIKLRMSISFTDYIRPINSLPVDDLFPGTDLRVIGWGQTSDESGSLAPTLQYADVVVLTNDECKTTYGDQIKDNMVCVEGNYNEGACHGDTGSPLVEMYSNRFTVLSGIASFVSGRGCESIDPSGYQRTFSIKQWIRNTTGT